MAYPIRIVCVVYQDRGKQIANLVLTARERLTYTQHIRSALSLTDRNVSHRQWNILSALVVQTLVLARQMPREDPLYRISSSFLFCYEIRKCAALYDTLNLIRCVLALEPKWLYLKPCKRPRLRA